MIYGPNIPCPRISTPILGVALGLITLVAFTFALGFRDLYGLEARNALIAKEMLTGGLKAVPAVLGRPYPDYLPLYFWIEYLFSLPAHRVTTFSAVLPSALSASGMVAMTFLLGSRISRQTGIISALILATFPEFWLKGSRATIDMLLAMEVGLAVLLFFTNHQKNHGRLLNLQTLGGLCASFLAFFTKGAIGLVLPGTIWGLYLLAGRHWRSLFRFCVLFFVFCLGCLMVEALLVYNEGGMPFLREVIQSQITRRVLGERDSSPLYYPFYLIKAGGIWWLWIICIIYKGLRDRHISAASMRSLSLHPVTQLALIWFLAVFVIFAMASAQHGRYLLPLFPALALIMGSLITGLMPQRIKYGGHGAIGLTILFVLTVSGFWIFFGFGPYPCRVPLKWLLAWSALSMILYAAFSWEPLLMPFNKLPGRHRFLKFLAGCLPSEEGPRLFAYSCLLSAAMLSGANLFLEPALSARESGRVFALRVEQYTPDDIPIVFFRVHEDGDAIKYVLYSNREANDFRFANSANELLKYKRPFILILYSGDRNRLQPLLQRSHANKIGTGLIHRKGMEAYLFE